MYMCIFTYMYICVNVYMYIYINIYICIYVCACVCVCVYVCVCVGVCVCVCVCVCVWRDIFFVINLYSFPAVNLVDTTRQTDSELVVMRFFLNTIFLKVTETPRMEFIIILLKANSIMVTLLGIFWLVFLGIFRLLPICFRFLVGTVAKFHF